MLSFHLQEKGIAIWDCGYIIGRNFKGIKMKYFNTTKPTCSNQSVAWTTNKRVTGENLHRTLTVLVWRISMLYVRMICFNVKFPYNFHFLKSEAWIKSFKLKDKNYAHILKSIIIISIIHDQIQFGHFIANALKTNWQVTAIGNLLS